MADLLDIGKDFKVLAIEKIDKELKEFNGDRYGNACFSYAGHTISDAPDLVKHHLERAFTIAEKVVRRMQELAEAEQNKQKDRRRDRAI